MQDRITTIKKNGNIVSRLHNMKTQTTAKETNVSIPQKIVNKSTQVRNDKSTIKASKTKNKGSQNGSRYVLVNIVVQFFC